MIERAARAVIVLLFVVAMNTSTPLQVSAAPAAEKEKPCSAAPYRQFDFWLGSWDVTEKGKMAGTNRIERILGGCALHESWHGAGGLHGNSINYYDAPRGVWHQTWIDERGNGLVLEGEFENGVMRLEGKRPGSAPGATDSAPHHVDSPFRAAMCVSCGRPRPTTARPGTRPSMACTRARNSCGRWRFRAFAAVWLATALPAIALRMAGASDAASAQTSRSCTSEPRLHALDFWLGQWDVYSGNEKDGTNRIVRVLHGCAVEEHWRDVEGSEGQSLFYFNRAGARWKQVWVTEQGLAIGGTKEKSEQTELTTPTQLRFQGQYPGRDGAPILDRTTLTHNPDDTVRQLIDISFDNGQTWRVTFDAIYRRHESRGRDSSSP